MAAQLGERYPVGPRGRRRLAAALALLLLAASGCGDDERRPPTDPTAGRWRTWFVDSGRIDVAPPPARGSTREKQELDELRALARRRTPAQERAARHWSQDPAVAPWVERALGLVSHRLTQKDPPAAAREYALLSVAMEDAVIETWKAKYRYKRNPPKGVDALIGPGGEPSYPSEHAAIAGAASRVLAYAFSEEPAPRLDREAEEAARSRVVAGVNYPSDIDAGLDIGRRVAARVIERAKRDGSDIKWDGHRPRGKRYWEPPPGSLAVPVRPGAAKWRTWLLSSPSEMRPPAPPRYGSRKFVAETREVLDVARRLTPEQKRIAQMWAGGEGTALPPGLWNKVTLAQVRQAGLSTPRATRVFALINTAMADAAIACWDAKYAYWSPRPANAIRDLGLARDWKPLLKTPAFPSFPSGHSTFSAAAAEVLAHLFPERAAQFRAKAREAAVSRLYGGIHFRTDNEAGLRLGEGIGGAAVKRAQRDGAEQ